MIDSVSNLPLRLVQPRARHALGGIWRMTFRKSFSLGQGILLIGLLGLVTVLALASIRGGRENFYSWIVHFYLTFLIPLLGFIAGASTIRDEMKSSSADYILTRPVRRSALVAFKYISQLVCLQGFYLVVFSFLIGLAVLNQVPDILSAAPLLLLAQIGALFGFSALGLFFGALTSRYLIVGVIYAATIELAVGRIPTQLNRISMLHQIDLIVGPLTQHGPLGLLPGVNALAAFALVVVFPAVFVSLAATVFSLREIGELSSRET